MHQKHSNISRAKFGNFARNELAFLGTPCAEIKFIFEKITENFPQKTFAIVEADHQAEEPAPSQIKWIDKINFRRFDTIQQPNQFEYRPFFEAADLVLVNGNHFLAEKQVIIIDTKKPLESKLAKLTNVQLIILKDAEIPAYILTHLGENLPPIIKWHELEKLFDFLEKFINNSIPELYGLVLAGGKSSRMGADKSEIQYHGQVSQQIYASNLLKNFCGENVFLSKKEAKHSEKSLEIRIIEDTFLGIGPMGGILSAFQKYPNVAWLVVACDLPFLTEKSLRQLVDSRNPFKLATTFKSPENDFPEPLISIWEPKAYPKLLQMLAYGYDCPRKTLINSDIQLLINDQENELQNINTVEQFEKVIIQLSPKLV